MKVAPQIMNTVTMGRITSSVSRQEPEEFTLTLDRLRNPIRALLTGTGDVEAMHEVLRGTEVVPAQQGSAGNSTAYTRRMMVESVHCKIRMKNHTNAQIDVVLYDIVPKKDEARDVSGTLPSARWTTGIGHERVDLGGTTDNAQVDLLPGATPFQSQYFCQYYTVKKVTRFVLHAGSEHHHIIKILPKYLMNRTGTVDLRLMRGLSTYCMAVIKGPIAHDAGGAPVRVTYAPCVMDYVCETQYKFRSMEKNVTGYSQYTMLPDTMPSPQTVLEDEDTVAPIASA